MIKKKAFLLKPLRLAKGRLKERAEFIEIAAKRTKTERRKNNAPIYPFKVKSANELTKPRINAAVLKPLRVAFLAVEISGVSGAILLEFKLFWLSLILDFISSINSLPKNAIRT